MCAEKKSVNDHLSSGIEEDQVEIQENMSNHYNIFYHETSS